MMHHTSNVNFGVGSLAFLAGVLATIVTAYAIGSRRERVQPTHGTMQYNHYEGWDEGLGV